jgi:CO/xanthine dehydrogenase Mo-binding subunit
MNTGDLNVEFDTVGKSQPRVDGFEKVVGRAQFIADLNPGRVLHARVVRSTLAHAFIRGLDSRRALAIQGVKAIVTGEACPRRIGHAIADQFPIARGKVRYWGEPVAVVVAATLEAANTAAQLVEVEYEPLPFSLHPRQAAGPDAPILHEDLADYAHDPLIHPIIGSNICHHYRLTQGNIDQAFAQADLIIENDYWVPWIAPCAA